jgi:carbonic anhydrase
MEAISVSPAEKPANGLAGLKYWRQDILAGLLVSLISLPFSLGIAVASGAPPVCGLISAIIAGLLLPFLGGSFVTISGPAAGLAPVLFAAMLSLGKGDTLEAKLAHGYPLLLCAIAFCGALQIILSLLKAAKISAIFPSTVVEAILASIGLLIIVKQLPYFLGVPFQAHDFFPYLAELPGKIQYLNPKVLGLGIFSLALIFGLSSMKTKWVKIVPPQVIAVVVAIFVGRLLGLTGTQLIHVPDKPFEHGVVMPNFTGLFSDSSLMMPLIIAVLTLAMVDGVESLATASAIDRIDPYRRKSDPNRVLLAMGISNICSSMAGGLTIIPGGVKSTACIEGGGKTLWANFYNAIFLILFLFWPRI